MMKKHLLFEERQRFTQWWLWVLFAGLLVLMTCLLVFVIKPPLPLDRLLLTIGGMFLAFMAAPCLMLLLRLDTRITEEGVHVRFFPVFSRFYEWGRIDKCHVREYRPVGEYGGWGIKGCRLIRGNRLGDLAFTVSGNHGLQLELADGKKRLIGTQRPEELAKILARTGHLTS